MTKINCMRYKDRTCIVHKLYLLKVYIQQMLQELSILNEKRDLRENICLKNTRCIIDLKCLRHLKDEVRLL